MSPTLIDTKLKEDARCGAVFVGNEPYGSNEQAGPRTFVSNRKAHFLSRVLSLRKIILGFHVFPPYKHYPLQG